MPDPNFERTTDYADAAMAHNRWPTIGLFVGFGLGVVSSLIFVPGLMWSIIQVIGMAIVGCFLGWALATIVYRGADQLDTQPPDDHPGSDDST